MTFLELLGFEGSLTRISLSLVNIGYLTFKFPGLRCFQVPSPAPLISCYGITTSVTTEALPMFFECVIRGRFTLTY